MTKKNISLILLLALTVTCICSCSSSQEQYLNESVNTEQSVLSYEDDCFNQSDSTFVETQTQIMYLSFEECLSAATHVVSATYKGEYETHGIYKDLVFSVAEQYKGTDIPDEIHLRVCDQTISVVGTDIGYSTSANDYRAGETYLLVLEKHVSVYYPYDLYLAYGNIKITNDNAVMYDGTDVKAHSNKLDNTSSNDVISYVENYVKNSVPPAAQGFEFIRNSTLEHVIDSTTIIAVVTPTEYIGGSENNNTSRYLCTVNEVIKGSLNDTDIKVIFVAGSVELDCEYIVMLEEMGPYYILSSQNSVHDAGNSSVIQQVKDMVSVD